MKELIIDTATNLLFVGLKTNEKAVFKTRIGKNDNAAYLVEYINLILLENNIKLDELDNIIVGIGPGSYTGARVSVVVAKTLSYTKNINLKTISSLNLLSSGYEGIVTPLIDARRGFYFSGKYDEGKEIIKDRYIEEKDLINEENVIILNEETIKVNLDIASKNAITCKNIHELEPNYLRKTEAETTYDKKNGIK